MVSSVRCSIENRIDEIVDKIGTTHSRSTVPSSFTTKLEKRERESFELFTRYTKVKRATSLKTWKYPRENRRTVLRLYFSLEVFESGNGCICNVLDPIARRPVIPALITLPSKKSRHRSPSLRSPINESSSFRFFFSFLEEERGRERGGGRQIDRSFRRWPLEVPVPTI